MRNYFALKQLWLWKKNTLWIWIETIILTAVILLICYGANPKNPLFLHSIFPWPWIAPVIIVLRYGFGPGLLSAFIVAVAAIVSGPRAAILLPNYQGYILSGFVLTFFCALFSASAIRRMNNAEELLHYSQERLNNLSRSYYVLHASYNYLEQNLIMQPITLRSVLLKIQEMLVHEQGKLSANIAHRFLELVCQYCNVNQAGIYVCERNKFQTNSLVEVGLMGPLIPDDPLVLASTKSTDICYISINQLDDPHEAQYLVTAPMRNSEGNLLAILVIKEMAFKTLTVEMLQILSILINYFSAEMTATTTMNSLLTAYPSCPPQFAQELNKLLLLKKRMDVDSGLVAILVAKNLSAHNVIYMLQQQQRILDSVWVTELADFQVLITLLPLTDGAGIQGYLHRITEYLKMNLGLKIDQKTIKSRFLQLSDKEPKLMIQHFLAYLEEATS